jgi:hypothetical protein
MSDMLRVEVTEDGVDTERLDVLTRYLRAELLELDVDDVTAERAVPPTGARAVDVAAVGALLVHLGDSAKSLAAVIAAARDWLTRGAGVRRTVRLELDGDVIELSQAGSAEVDRLVDLFVAKHSRQAHETPGRQSNWTERFARPNQ